MDKKIGRPFAVIVGIVCVLATSLAMAGSWSVKTHVGKIVVRDDQTVLVNRVGGKWQNPDLCDNDASAVLRGPGDANATAAYKEIFASLVAAHMANREIKVYLQGCTTVGNKTYPTLVRITVF